MQTDESLQLSVSESLNQEKPKVAEQAHSGEVSSAQEQVDGGAADRSGQEQEQKFAVQSLQNQRFDGYAPGAHPRLEKTGPDARQWLNVEVTPVLLEGTRRLVRTRPDRPLRALAEFLLDEDRKKS